jgi:sucrose-6F-phosphate phosphohydrolase
MKLLCTDLDRTLVPNGEQHESPLARPVLWQLLRSHDMALAYVSGRDLDRVLSAIAEYALQVPDFIVADVGTSIHVPAAGGWQLQSDWSAYIARDWNGLDSEGIRRSLASVMDLQDQEDDRQAPFKRSYYLPANADTAAIGKQLQTHLHDSGIDASLVFSDDSENGVGLLDVLPRHATKLDAILHVCRLCGAEQSRTLFSGDSGNDVTALASGLPSVTVRNADEPTRRAVQRLAELNGTIDSSYQASGGLPLADGTELNGNYAAGIVEGLVHFTPEWAEDLLSAAWLDGVQALAQDMK